jgi:hypothetical protein
MLIKRKSQSLTEYSVVLLIIVAAVASMRVYMKRGIQAAVRATAEGYLDPSPSSDTQVDELDYTRNSSVNSTTSNTFTGTRTQHFVGDGSQVIGADLTTTISGNSNSWQALEWPE